MIATFTALGLASSLLQYLVDAVSPPPALWWAMMIGLGAVFLSQLLLMVRLVLRMRRGAARCSVAAIVAATGCFTLLLQGALFIAIVVSAPISPAIQRTLWSASITAWRTIMSLVFLVADSVQQANALQAELQSVELRRASAEAANNSQKMFTRWLFHELRVPMQAMVLSIEELQEALQPIPVAPASGDDCDQRLLSQLHMQHECAATAQAGAVQVCKLLDSVLSLAKVEAGAAHVESAPFHVTQDLVRGTAAMFRTVLEKRQMHLTLHVAPTIAEVVSGDAVKLKMALANFMSNAIKFSPPGSFVTVVVEGAMVPSSLLLQSIADPESRPWVNHSRPLGGGASAALRFAEELRAGGDYVPHPQSSSVDAMTNSTSSSSSNSSSISGSGWLSAVWRMIQAFTHHRGTTTAPPVEPSELPVASSAAASTAAPSIPCLRLSVTDSGTGMALSDMRNLFRPFVQVRSTHVHTTMTGSGLGLSICQRMIELCGGRVGVASQQGVGSTFWLEPLRWAVVADDVASNLAMFARLLTRRGVRVLMTAEHGADCLAKLEALPAETRELLRTSPGSAWFLDRTMPVMDGLELTRRLRADWAVTAPIFAVTADALAEDQAAYIAGGATAVIAKPCTQATVTAALARACLGWPAATSTTPMSVSSPVVA